MKWDYSLTGNGPTILLIHGLFGSRQTLGSLAHHLKNNFQVLSPSLRNHGDSPWLKGMDYHNHAQDLLKLMDQENIQKAHIIGHSMGGKAAMALALLHPSRCHSMVALDIAPVTYPDTYLDAYIQYLKKIPLDKIQTREDADTILKENIPEKSIRSFLLTNLVHSENTYHWRCNLEELYKSRENIFGFSTPELNTNQYTGPAMFLYSETSSYLLPKHIPTIEMYFPNSQQKAIKEAGHWIHADQPEQVLEELQSFLSTNFGN